MASRLCRICGGWHDLDEAWPVACSGHFHSPVSEGIQLIRDIDPYKAVGYDVATGTAPVIGGRRQHREFLKRNGYIEVGNEKPKLPKVDYQDITPRDVRQVYEGLRDGRYRR